MFGYLKNKLKDAVDKFSKEVDEDSEVVQDPEQTETPVEETSKTEEETKESPAEPQTKKAEKESAEKLEETEEPPKEKKGFFDKFRKSREAEATEKTAEEVQKDTTEDKQETTETAEQLQETSEVESELETEEQVQEAPEVREEKSEEAEQVQKEPKTTAKEKLEKEPLHEKPKEQEEEQNQEESTRAESEEESKQGFFGKFRSSVVDAVTKSAISEEKFNELFWDVEVVLLENNVAVEVIEKIKQDLKDKLVNTKVRRGSTADIIINTLNDSIYDLFKMEKINLEQKAQEKKPYIISFVGINGSGKTTTIAKLAHILKEKGYSSVIAASDTFRAAAIQQLEEHADNVGVKLIKHDYGADPAAVAFDAIKYAESKKTDFVFIDTAGRLHSNSNLIDEMKKIMRVGKPDLKLFVGESTTGNDCVEQAQRFNEAIGIDGIILAKSDVDPKGGAAISISYVTGKPILYMGTGQDYQDLEEFDPQLVVKNLGLSG